jgi:hypothetical protein
VLGGARAGRLHAEHATSRQAEQSGDSASEDHAKRGSDIETAA